MRTTKQASRFRSQYIRTLFLLFMVGCLVSYANNSQVDKKFVQTAEAAAVGDLVGQGSIAMNGAKATVPNLILGARYKIVISGTFKFNSDDTSNPMNADAQWIQVGGCYCDHNNGIAFNGSQLTSNDFKTTANPSHVYTWLLTPNTTSLQIWLVDSNYADNTGSLTYKVFIDALPPTATPTRTPTPTPTRTPTPTLTPTPVPNTKFSLDLLLHGLGSAGDSASPGVGGNPNPIHTQRAVTVEAINSQNQLVASRNGTVVYDSASGSFKGVVDMGPTVTSGVYIVKIKTSQYLKTQVVGIQNLVFNTTNVIPRTTMVTGDINNDNVMNIIDYNILLGCYSDFLPPVSCTASNKVLADITDDGAVNQFDYNLFLRELTNLLGQ